MPTAKEILRIAAVGDLHCGRASAGTLRPLFEQVAERADLLLLCGDLCDYGLPEEAHILVRELGPAAHLPIVAVLGNHDYESDKQHEVSAILGDAGMHLLDGEAIELAGVGFAGVRGFAGGFGTHTINAWGESIIKAFVKEAMDEQIKLESALARLRTAHRIALLHYSPIRETVLGEPLEILPFMGTTRLEEPLNRYSVTAAVHGHAHRGTPEGRTSAGIPVYNVSLPLLRRAFPERPPFRLIELRVGVPPDGRAGMAPGQTTEPDIQLDDKPATERDEARTATTSTAT